MKSEYWIIETVFTKPDLIEKVINWIARNGQSSSILLNLSQFDIHGDNKKYTAGEVIDWLIPKWTNKEKFSYGIRPISSSPSNPKYELLYLSPYGSFGFRLSNDQKEALGKELNFKSHGFFYLLKVLGFKIDVVQSFPKEWDVYDHISTEKTIGDLLRRKGWIIAGEKADLYKDKLFFWATKGSYKGIFSMKPEYFSSLIAHLKKVNIVVRELK